MQRKMNQYNNFYKDRNVTCWDEKFPTENEAEVGLLRVFPKIGFEAR